jgi:hypothetical protein
MPHVRVHSGLGIAAVGLALIAGAGLAAAFSLFGFEPLAVLQNQRLLILAMVGSGLLEFVAIALAWTALIDDTQKVTFPVAALLLACGPLCLVTAVFLIQDG